MTIQATVDGVTGSAALIVQQEIDQLVLSAHSLVLDRWGDTEQVTVEAVDAVGTIVDGTSVQWSSSDPDIVSIDAIGNGHDLVGWRGHPDGRGDVRGSFRSPAGGL